MGKKIVNILFCFISGMVLVALFSFVLSDYDKKKEKKMFIYKGFLDYGIETTSAFFDSGFTPKEISVASHSKEPVVGKPNTAFKIAKEIFIAKFGRDFYEEQSPYTISLINGKIWKIRGSLKMTIYIQSADAQILSLKKYEK